MNAQRLIYGLITLLLVACTAGEGESGAIPEASGATGEQASEQLERLVEDYFEVQLEMNPVFASLIGDHRYNDRWANNLGPEYLARSRAIEEQYLAAIEEIDPGELTGQDLLSYEIFKRDRLTAIEGFQFPAYLLPINQFFSRPNFFAVMGSGSSVHPFQTVDDYEDWLSRVEDFAVWVEQAQINMREGIEIGVVQPRVLMEKVLPQLEVHLVDDVQQSVFYKPIENLPEDFSDEDRVRLDEAYRLAIETKIIPMYRGLYDFIKEEYLPATRETVGLRALPDGERWYAYLVRRTTTTELSPDEIHEIGLAEVERIHREMTKVMEEVGFEGDLQAFFDYLNTDERFFFENRDDLLDGYRALRDGVHTNAARLFLRMPKADYEIRAVEPFREKSAAGGQYLSPSPDGSRPGVFYVNTYDLSARPKWSMESLFLHEAVPGHHFQGSTALELEVLPRFRRFGGYTAYGEGWGLYAESLGKDLGVYQDPYQYFGALAAELWRAIRLVVDTGLHSKGWTREQVIDYMYANTAVKEARAVAEAERYIAIPSQALAYKIGQLKISELRERAERALGDEFDVRVFHSEILDDGELPLAVLEAKVDRWINGEG